MEFLASPAGLLIASVLGSLIFTVSTTPNPAKIPFVLVLPRAAAGLLLFVLFWIPVCLLLYWPLSTVITAGPVAWCLAALIGFVVPQAGKLKDRFLTTAVAKLAAPLFGVIQAVDEETRLYLSKIINREERKVSLSFFSIDTANRSRALDRLYEYRNIDIAHELAHQPGSPREAVLGVFRVRQQPIKFKYLMRHLGFRDCLRDLRKVAQSPGMIFPTWPAELGDRRKAESDLASPATSGRRKYERLSELWYVQGVVPSRLKKRYQVFVSSTYLDLKEERQQVLKTLLLADCIPAGMELFPCSDADLLSLIYGVVDECDFYIVLVGARYGSTTSAGISYTEAEYDYASRSGKPILAFLHAAPNALATEDAERAEKLRAFRERIQREHAPAYWNDAAELPALILQAIQRQKDEHPAGGWVRAPM